MDSRIPGTILRIRYITLLARNYKRVGRKHIYVHYKIPFDSSISIDRVQSHSTRSDCLGDFASVKMTWYAGISVWHNGRSLSLFLALVFLHLGIVAFLVGGGLVVPHLALLVAEGLEAGRDQTREFAKRGIGILFLY